MAVVNLHATREHSSLVNLNAQNEAVRYLALFLLDKEGEGLSVRTIDDYRQKLGRFTDLVGSKSLADIDQADVFRFMADVRTTCKPISVQRYFLVLRVWFNWLVYNEYLDKSPMAKMKRPKVEHRIIQPFSPGQIKDLLDLCDGSFIGLRDRAVILVLLDTGLRVSEFVSVRLEDIDTSRRVIKVMGKGARERVVAYGKATSAAVAKYVVARTSRLIKWGRPDPGVLFMSEEGRPLSRFAIQAIIQGLGKRAGIQGVRCSPHTFRHTFGTSAILNGASMRETQLLLGHSTDDMTRQYTATIDSMYAAERHQAFSPVDRLHL